MADDIVTRLRESNGMTTSRSDDGFLSIHPDTDLLRLAADEIERLRSALQVAAGLLSTYLPEHPLEVLGYLMEEARNV